MKRKVITSNQLAKELLSVGFKIIDIAPHKTDKKRTIFVFEDTQELQLYLEVKEGRENEQNKHKTKYRRTDPKIR